MIYILFRIIIFMRIILDTKGSFEVLERGILRHEVSFKGKRF